MLVLLWQMRSTETYPGCETSNIDARVAWISVAPVKGLALAQREEVLLEPSGVREDRRFHMIGEDGRLLNGKRLGELFRVTADWDEDTQTLALRFPDGSLAEAVVDLAEPVTTSFYGHDREGRLVAGPWADALSSFVGRPLRLVQPVEPGGGLDRRGGGVTLLSTGSLEAMREASGANGPVDPRRFRMLFGVEGVEPHEEDCWISRLVRIGEAAALVRGNVGRCIVTSRDPDTGARTLPTLDALADYRGDVQTTEPLPFGVWGEVAEPGRVRLGDAIVPF